MQQKIDDIQTHVKFSFKVENKGFNLALYDENKETFENKLKLAFLRYFRRENKTRYDQFQRFESKEIEQYMTNFKLDKQAGNTHTTFTIQFTTQTLVENFKVENKDIQLFHPYGWIRLLKEAGQRINDKDDIITSSFRISECVMQYVTPPPVIKYFVKGTVFTELLDAIKQTCKKYPELERWDFQQVKDIREADVIFYVSGDAVRYHWQELAARINEMTFYNNKAPLFVIKGWLLSNYKQCLSKGTASNAQNTMFDQWGKWPEEFDDIPIAQDENDRTLISSYVQGGLTNEQRREMSKRKKLTIPTENLFWFGVDSSVEIEKTMVPRKEYYDEPEKEVVEDNKKELDKIVQRLAMLITRPDMMVTISESRPDPNELKVEHTQTKEICKDRDSFFQIPLIHPYAKIEVNTVAVLPEMNQIKPILPDSNEAKAQVFPIASININESINQIEQLMAILQNAKQALQNTTTSMEKKQQVVENLQALTQPIAAIEKTLANDDSFTKNNNETPALSLSSNNHSFFSNNHNNEAPAVTPPAKVKETVIEMEPSVETSKNTTSTTEESESDLDKELARLLAKFNNSK